MTESLIDQSVFDELRETAGDDFAAELVNTFLEEAPGMLAELKAAVDSGNADAYRRAAHSMKSNANVFGAAIYFHEHQGDRQGIAGRDVGSLSGVSPWRGFSQRRFPYVCFSSRRRA